MQNDALPKNGFPKSAGRMALALSACAALALQACAAKDATPGPTGPSGPTSVSIKDVSAPSGTLGPKVVASKVEIGAACAHDWDCWTNQLCDNTSNRAVPGKCAAATDDQKGESSKTVAAIEVAAAGDYLISVSSPADLPADSVTDQAVVKFAFESARRSPVSLKKLRPVTSADSDIARAMMDPRNAIENEIRAFERKVHEQQLPLVKPSPIRATCPDNEVSFKVAGADKCIAIDGTFTLKALFASNAVVTVALKRLSKTNNGATAILVDTRDSVPDVELDALLTGFDTIAARRDRLLFNAGAGHTGALDVDGNGVVGIVLSRAVSDAKLAGIYDSRDVVKSTGNDADIVWSAAPGATFLAGATTVTITRELVLGTLAHEYQHLINFLRREAAGLPPETLFLNEGLSHLAEDLTGYGKSNIASVGLYLGDALKVGMLQGGAGTDRNSNEMRGLIYLYLRSAYEKAGGASFSAAGALTDRGGVAMIEKMMTSATNGVASLGVATGSMWENLPLFFLKLGASNQSVVAPLLASDTRFQFAATTVDPQTSQPVGISLNDPSREDTRGANPLTGYAYSDQACDKDKAEGDGCELYSTGGYVVLWEGAAVGDKLTVTTTPVNLVRAIAVRAK